jgi:hypothetical protein
MMQVAVQLAHLPVNLVCLQNGLIAFVRSSHFETIYESCDGYNVCIDEEGIEFTGDKLDSPLCLKYNSMISYKDNPVLKDWLINMNLTSPI